MPIYLQHGNLIDYVPPTDTSTEDVVFMGGLVGIPQTFIPAGELGALSVDGVYIFNKKDGVAVNLGEVVKYCGTTKLAQDSNADLTLGVAVADADADDFGVKVKINSVLPTDGGGGGGGGGGEVALCGYSGLYFASGEVAIKYCGHSAIRANGDGIYLALCGDSGLSIQDGELVASGGGGGGGGEVAAGCGLAFNGDGELIVATSCGLKFNGDGELVVNVAYGYGIDFNEYGQLVATGGGGGGGSGEVSIDTSRGLNYYNGCSIGINIGSGLSFDCGQLVATGGGDITLKPNGGLKNEGCGLSINVGDGLEILGCTGALSLNVCTASGLSFQNGELVASGGGGLQNKATGDGSLSILGQITTSRASTSVGVDANASGCGSTAIGLNAAASECGSTAIGFNAAATGCGSTAIGLNVTACGNFSTAFGLGTLVEDVGVTSISAWNDNGNARTQIYLIGAGSTMSTTYCDGEAGLGFMSKDGNGRVLKRGTIKLSAIMTENTDTFTPSGW